MRWLNSHRNDVATTPRGFKTTCVFLLSDYMTAAAKLNQTLLPAESRHAGGCKNM